MSKPTVVLVVGGSKPYALNGRYLYIDSATGDFTVSVILVDGTSSHYELRRREQLRFDQDMREVHFTNMHGATNTIVFQAGYAEFIPSNDGQKVTLTGQDVDINTKSADIGATGDAAATSDSGTFSLLALMKRLLGKFPVSIGQKATGGSLSVTLASNHDTVVVQQVLYGSLNHGSETTGDLTIPANVDRLRLHIFTDAANTGVYWTGGAVGSGLKLAAGMKLDLETSAAITLKSSNGTDKITYLEIEA